MSKIQMHLCFVIELHPAEMDFDQRVCILLSVFGKKYPICYYLIITHYYICYYIIVTSKSLLPIITVIMDPLLPIITRSIMCNNGSIITYY